MVEILLYIIALFFIAVTFLPLIRKDHWAIRIFDFPHVQITVINVMILGLILVFLEVDTTLDFILIIVLVAGIIYQSFIIYPYTPLAKVQVCKSDRHTSASAFSLMVANVLMGNKNADKCKRIIEKADPDLLLLIETNEWWRSQLEEVVKGKYAYHIEYPLENTYGMLLYSKLELKDLDIKFLVQKDVPSFHTKVKLKSGIEVMLHCLHPDPPGPTQSETSTDRDAELLVVGKKIIGPDVPTIVAGDLNDVAWSYTTRLFIKISGLLDPRLGRGFFNTFHAGYPLMRWPLDHVFISNHFKLLELNRLPYMGSDHFPILIKVNYEPDAEEEQEQPEADEEEKEFAEEKIDKVKQD